MNSNAGGTQPERNFDKNITYQSMVDLSRHTFGNLFLANGAGVLALLTLIGHMENKACGVGTNIGHYWWSIGLFLAGVVFAIVASGLAYKTQYRIFVYDKAGWIFSLAVWASLVSLACFVGGAIYGAFFVSALLG